jgi:hypothetical protein
MQIGSDAHKELFCRTFFEGHRRYEPAELAWPSLDESALALLRGLPFWTHARQFEADAGPVITAVAARESDPLIREALELQAFEETRHARLLEHMFGLYQLSAEDARAVVPPDPIREFVTFGFEECLDSFGAFGLYKLARDSRLVPDALFEIFENVMREESFHIVFFINWWAHRQVRLGGGARWLRAPHALWHYARALRKIGDLVRGDDTPEGADFIATGARAFVDELTPRLVIRTCVEENERRMAAFDRRLIVPSLIPRLAGLANGVLRLLPERRAAPPPPAGSQSPSDSARAPRAA